MEEGSEFLERLKHRDEYTFPMFTSCCPGWVRYLKGHHPEMAGQLSTAKSPHQMQGAITKTYFAEKMGIDPDKIFNISIMPCVAKKAEADIPNMNDAGHGKDVDLVLTTREIVRMIRADHLDVRNAISESEFDTPLGTGTGAAVIFGATGGVMEAALRTCYHLITGKNPYPDAFYMVRGLDWLEGSLHRHRRHDRARGRRQRAGQYGKAHPRAEARRGRVRFRRGHGLSRRLRRRRRTADPRWTGAGWHARRQPLLPRPRQRAALLPTRTRISSISTRTIWARRSRTARTSCCTPDHTGWKMPGEMK